jgi:ABC-type Fe3+ transport system permease subunit
MTALWNTVWVSVGAAVMAAGFGWAFATSWMGAHRRLRPWMLGIAAVNQALPPFLLANCWLEVSSAWRLEWGGETSAVALLPLTALVLAGMHWPIPAILLIGEWSRVERPSLDLIPGLRGWGVLRHIQWPSGREGLGVAAVVCGVLAAANFSIPTLFQVRVLPELLWVRFNTQLDVRGAWVAGWPLVALGGMALLCVGRRKVMWPLLDGGAEPSLWRRSLGWNGRICDGLSVGIVALSLGLPLGLLLTSPRTWTELGPASRAGAVSIATSVIVAAVVAGGLLLLSLLLVHGVRRTGPWRWIAWLWFLMPGILISVLWVPVLAKPSMRWLANSALVYALLLMPRYLAIPWSLGLAALDRADPATGDALRTSGCRPVEVWWHAVWPQVRGMNLLGAYIVYLLVLWDVESILLVMPAGMDTVAVRVFNLLHYGHAGQVNALCVVLLGIAVLPILVWRVVSMIRWRFLIPGAALFVVVGCGDPVRERRVALESRWFSHVEVIGHRGVGPGQFNKPRSLVCDRNDNLYVADVTGRIQKFDANGRFLLQWQMPQTDLGKPKGMGLDAQGNILVIEPHYMRVNHFDPEGRLVAQWGTKGTNAGRFILPRAIGLNSLGEFFVSEYTVVDRVQRFGPIRLGAGGDVLELPRFGITWGEPGEPSGHFNRAEGLGIGPSDHVYVADSCNHRIQVFDREGRFLRMHGRAGSASGALSYPYDVRVEPDGTQFICEFGNSRISIVDARDQLVEIIGGAGAEPGRFANPWAVAFDSRGNLYVADSQNHRVQKLIRRDGVGAVPVARSNQAG